jgi:hypothetical protein
MNMAHENYILLARNLRQRRADFDVDGAIRFGVEAATVIVADALAATDPKFNREVFLIFAGVPADMRD